MYLALPSSLYDFMLLENNLGKIGDEVRKWISQSLVSLFFSLFPLLCLTDFFFFLSQMLLMMHKLLEPMWKIFHKRNAIPLVLLPGIIDSIQSGHHSYWFYFFQHRNIFSYVDIDVLVLLTTQYDINSWGKGWDRIIKLYLPNCSEN